MYISVKQAAEKFVNLELMKAGYPPIDIKFAGYVNERLDSYLAIQEDFKI